MTEVATGQHEAVNTTATVDTSRPEAGGKRHRIATELRQRLVRHVRHEQHGGSNHDRSPRSIGHVPMGERREVDTPAPLTSRDLVTVIATGNPDARVTSPDTVGTEEVTVDQRTEQNNRLSGALHTLLVSVPDTNLRDIDPSLLSFVTQNSRDTNKYVATRMEEYHSDEERAEGVQAINDDLSSLVDTAITDVGGPERAQIILRYPGVSANEALESVCPSPDAWIKASLVENTYAPQNPYSACLMLGKQMWQDLAEGNVSWDDAIHTYLDTDQLADEKKLVAKLHAAFRKNPAMPEGHDHPRASHTIPDEIFQYVWREELRRVFSAALLVSNWAEEAQQVPLPATEFPYKNSKSYTLGPSFAERMKTFFGDERFQPYIEVTSQMFEAAVAAAQSEEGTEIRKQQRDAFNDRRPHGGNGDNDPVEALTTLVGSKMNDELGNLGETKGYVTPVNLADSFNMSLRAVSVESMSFQYPAAA